MELQSSTFLRRNKLQKTYLIFLPAQTITLQDQIVRIPIEQEQAECHDNGEYHVGSLSKHRKARQSHFIFGQKYLLCSARKHPLCHQQPT